MDKVEITSLNVRGLGSDVKRKKMFTWFKKQDISVVMLQETHSTERLQNKWRAEWGGEVYFSHGTNNARGTAILFNPKLKNLEVHEVQASASGRYVILDVSIKDLRFTLCTVYGPNTDDPDFFRTFIDDNREHA